jgi:hypothetical protein
VQPSELAAILPIHGSVRHLFRAGFAMGRSTHRHTKFPRCLPTPRRLMADAKPGSVNPARWDEEITKWAVPSCVHKSLRFQRDSPKKKEKREKKWGTSGYASSRTDHGWFRPEEGPERPTVRLGPASVCPPGPLRPQRAPRRNAFAIEEGQPRSVWRVTVTRHSCAVARGIIRSHPRRQATREAFRASIPC